MKWLSVKNVLEIHKRSLAESGGDPGIRDPSMLESAVAQPRARFGARISTRALPTRPQPWHSLW
jgi:prophage maintenance system killer protein